VVDASPEPPPYTVLMRHESPLRKQHADYQRSRPQPEPADAQRPGAARGRREGVPEVEFVPYEPLGSDAPPGCELVATYGDLESEYAAIRRGAAFFDSPHRGTIVITGAERGEFLNRMVTQELQNLRAGIARETFWLNRKGRIEADLFLIELGDRLLVSVDLDRAAITAESLSGFVFTEDVTIADATASYHHIAVHGPEALALLAAAGAGGGDLDALTARDTAIGGVETVLARRDQAGEVGLELIVPYARAEAVWAALLAAGDAAPGGARRARPVGWYAVNVARIEAGTPLYGIDFGPENLPHETGVLHERVSFTKGCYLGQEIVARIESQGRPRQVLVGLRPVKDLLPVAGAPVYARDEQDPDGTGPPIGAVTSSTLAPMLGTVPVAFAMIRSEYAAPDSIVLVSAEGEHAEAVVGGLRFHRPAEATP
jgi:folate-binding protein YgfZ